MNVAYIGFGSLGQQLKRLVDKSFAIDDEVKFDDTMEGCQKFNTFLDRRYKDYSFVIGVGYKHLQHRVDIINSLLDGKRHLLKIIEGSVHLSESSKIGDGCVIFPLCNIDEGVEIGAGTILHNSTVVSHDTKMGRGNYIAPGVVICGNCIIGDASFIGAGSIISNGISVGNNCMIGLGSTLTRNLPDSVSVIGNRILKSPLKII